MIEAIISALVTFCVEVIRWGGYWGVVILMAIESACIPLPSEIIMPLAGYLVSTGEFNIYLAATAGAFGCNVGSVFAYEAGKRGGRPFVARWGKYFLVGLDEVDAAERFFARWGSISILVGRLLPVIRTFIAFPAGVARMPLVPFHLYTFIGSWPFCFALAWVGRELGEKWNDDPRLKEAFHQAHIVIGVLGVLAVGFYIWHRVNGIRKNRAILAQPDPVDPRQP